MLYLDTLFGTNENCTNCKIENCSLLYFDTLFGTFYNIFSNTRLFTELQESNVLWNSVIGAFGANYNYLIYQ